MYSPASSTEGSYAHLDWLNTFLAIIWRSLISITVSIGYLVLDSSLTIECEIATESGSVEPIPILAAQRMSFASSSQLFLIAARGSFDARSNSDSLSAEKWSVTEDVASTFNGNWIVFSSSRTADITSCEAPNSFKRSEKNTM